MKAQYAPLTEEQLAAVQAYAVENGRRWKNSLLLDWYHARRPGHLHALRNSHGPSWLYAFKLPK
jgi:hypothetical protein